MTADDDKIIQVFRIPKAERPADAATSDASSPDPVRAMRHSPARRRKSADGWSRGECAGINPLGGGDGRALRRSPLANHGGPESCIGICEDAGEALTGVIEPRNVSSRSFLAILI